VSSVGRSVRALPAKAQAATTMWRLTAVERQALAPRKRSADAPGGIARCNGRPMPARLAESLAGRCPTTGAPDSLLILIFAGIDMAEIPQVRSVKTCGCVYSMQPHFVHTANCIMIAPKRLKLRLSGSARKSQKRFRDMPRFKFQAVLTHCQPFLSGSMRKRATS
jgi:hypothetical protein